MHEGAQLVIQLILIDGHNISQIQLRAFMHAARRLLAILVVLSVLSLSESPEKHDLTFVQISDPHLFDAGKKRPPDKDKPPPSPDKVAADERQNAAEKLDTWAAWDWALSYVNQLQDPDRTRIKFVVFTGDFGLEKVTDIAGNTDKECWGLNDAAAKVAKSFAALNVLKIYLVRGNNDLDADEDPSDVHRFDMFVQKVNGELNNLKTPNRSLPDVVNLTSLVSTPPPDVEQDGYKIVGLDSSSFKNKVSLPSASQGCRFGGAVQKGNQDAYQLKELERVYDLVWLKKPGQQALVFTHIPDLDDRNCIEPLKGTPKCASIASWNLAYAARSKWDDIMKKDEKKPTTGVAAVFAGHFHDSRRNTYDRPYFWTTSKNLSIQERTYVVPPTRSKIPDRRRYRTIKGVLVSSCA